ncbi:MAG TPA: glycosyltransferase N-terminal domain-containing protein [Chthoniobacterales bacterium]|nr:glycosyltransferase N-terminal domain-containing protein [Chthoniobacterales bacterium]
MLLILYNLLLPLFLVVSLPVYLRRMIRRGGYARNFFQRFGIFSRRLRSELGQGDWTWVRAVSVGEVLVATRLIEEIRRQDPTFRAVISTTTSTGYQLALDRAPEWSRVIYSPIDFYPLLLRIWRLMRPRAVVLIDSDLWPSFLAIAHQRNTPVFLANARLSPRSEGRYLRSQRLAKPLFWDRLTAVLSQDPHDAERWTRLGLGRDRIVLTGSIKYDTADVPPNPRFVDWLKDHGIEPDRPCLLGGSLHTGEEELLITVFRALRAKFADLFLILVPRHFERTPEVEKSLRELSVSYSLRSRPDFGPAPAVLIVDSTGELNDWYQTASVVVIGKSFQGFGGQNPVEPLLARKPVICGPHMENFKFLVEELVREKGILQLAHGSALEPAIEQLLVNQKGASEMVANADRVLAQHRGAAARAAAFILQRMRTSGNEQERA